MNFEEFENKARLYVVGAIDDDDLDAFRQARREFGERAEDFISECRKLNAVFALSLRPRPPRPETREKLLAQIREAMANNGNEAHHE